MKMLTLFVLLCAGMVLTNAAAVPEAEPDLIMEEQEVEEEASIQGEELLLNSTVPEAELHEEMTEEEQILEDDGLVFSEGCPFRWTRFNDRCYIFVETPRPWAFAEENCHVLGGNLATIHSLSEEFFVQGLIQRASNGLPLTWIGGTDAPHEGVWLWINGSPFNFNNWCHGEPNNRWGNEHCTRMNLGGGKCWDDINCYHNHPYVCAKTL